MILKNKLIKSRFILTILSIIFIYNILNFNIASAIDNKYNINLKASYGVDGRYKINSKTPINLVITNNGVEFQGKIQIETLVPDTNKYDLNTESINIAKNTTKSLWYNINIVNKFKVRLITDNNEVIHEETINVNKGRLNDGDILVGVLTDDFNGLNYISNINVNMNNNPDMGNKKLIPVSISEGVIEKNSKSLDVIDMIIINNYDTLKLTEDNITNLNQWISNGGILVVGTGENYKKVIGGINNKIINGTFSEAISRDMSIGESNVNILAVKMNIEDSMSLFEDNNFISKVIKKNGQVIVFPWDLAAEKISKSSENNLVWGEITSDFNNKIDNSREGFWNLNSLLSTVKDIGLPSFQLMIILFIIYILIIGVLIYIVLKRLNKRDYVWLLIPIISIGFTVLIYFIGSNSRVQDIIANKVNIVSVDLDGQTKIESYLGVLTAKSRKVVIEEPEDINLNLIEYDNYYNRYNNNYPSNENATMRLNMIKEGDKTYYNFGEVSSFSPEVFQVSNFNTTFEPLEQELKFYSGKLRGYITNNLGCDIKKLVVMTPYKIWDLGSLPSGEKISVEDSDKFTSALNMWEITNKIRDDNYNNGNKNKDSKKYELRTCELLDYLYNSSMYDNNKNTSKLIAVTEKEVEYDLKVNGKAPLNKNDTIFINDINISYKSEDGTIEYPYGYFVPYIMEQSNVDGHYDPNERTISGNLELILSYQLQEEDVVIEGINFQKNYSQGSSKMKGEYKIYNYKIKDYEVLNFDDELSLTNIEDYILDGNIKIKIHGNNEEWTRIPDISVKGKVK
ncbi:hypothetical protein [Clostridium sp. UBA1353]|uniref:hypothetical protein n=1 Tax=Clostridium sp. UBA1353 TaxID=1946347 RepID=UPI003217C089